jgi:hypothetical protein
VVAQLDGSLTRHDRTAELARRLGRPVEDLSGQASQMLSMIAKAALLTP